MAGHSIFRQFATGRTDDEGKAELIEIAGNDDCSGISIRNQLTVYFCKIVCQVMTEMSKTQFLYILLTFLLSVSCSQKPSETYMLRPHEELPEAIYDDGSFTKIFLAGTIDMGNSSDWQMELLDIFSRMDGRYILFNPRQENWDASRPGEMDYQVKWELDHLEEADMIIMYILGSSRSPISLLEMGLHARSGKMHVICEKDFYRYDNVRITCEYYDVPLYDDLDSFLEYFKRSI